jgi:hypothetical protein
MAKAKAKKPSTGDVVRFDLGHGVFAFGRIYSESIRIYRSTGQDRAPIGLREFVLWVANAGFKPGSPQLPVVAHDPLTPDEQSDPPAWVIDAWGKPRLLLNTEARPASADDIRRYQRLMGGTWPEVVAAIRESLGLAPVLVVANETAPAEPIGPLDLLRLPRVPGEVTIEVRVNSNMPSTIELRARDAIEEFFNARAGEEVDDVGSGEGVMIVHVVTGDLRKTAEDAFRLTNSLGIGDRTRVFAEETDAEA